MEKFDDYLDSILLPRCVYSARRLEKLLSRIIISYGKTVNYNINFQIITRIKSKESIIAKLERKNYDVTIENVIKHVHDIIGIRIVCPLYSELCQLIDIIRIDEEISIDKVKNYIKEPKKDGYLGFHMIVTVPSYLNNIGDQMWGIEDIKAEIQIRTMAMDYLATMMHQIGYYKMIAKSEELSDEIIKIQQQLLSIDQKFTHIKNNIIKKEEYIEENDLINAKKKEMILKREK